MPDSYIAGSFLFGAVLIGSAIAIVSKNPTPRSTLWIGVFLLCAGLAGSLAVNLIALSPPAITQVTISYLGNFYLLIAGIGGNFIVGASVMTFAGASATLLGELQGTLMTLDIPGQPPVPLGTMKGGFTGTVRADNPAP